MAARRPDRGGDDGAQARAHELLLAVAARLLGEVRSTGAFPTGEADWTGFRERVAPELDADEHLLIGEEDSTEPPRGDRRLSVHGLDARSVRLSCHYGSHSISETLRIDGVLEEGMAGFGISVGDPAQRIPLTPTEQEVLRLARGPLGERITERPDFRGARLLRVLPAARQEGAVVQILVVELYDDGLGVRFAYDDPVEPDSPVPLHLYELAGIAPPIEAMLAAARAEGGNPPPSVKVADDVGTGYRPAGGGRGGVQVAEGASFFTPGPPDAAGALTVSTYAGTVEFDLRGGSV